MIEFIKELKTRNGTLFYFGFFCLGISILFLVLTRVTSIQVYNINAWYKPFKFAFSTFLFSWAMGWYCYYLKSFNANYFNISVVLLLGFEIVYIAIQAGRGQLSHYNLSTPIYAALYSFMAIAASLVTIYTAYVGFLFFTNTFPELPGYYVWAIRFGILIFVIFSFEGFVMGSRLSHTIGAQDGGEGLPLLNWSIQAGDPRVAHFIGMHALQVLPIVSFYIFRNVKATIFISFLYLLMAIFTLIQALRGQPLFKQNPNHYEIVK